jgi:hypothetical protein
MFPPPRVSPQEGPLRPKALRRNVFSKSGAVYGGDAEDVLMRVTRLPPLLGKARELCIEALHLGGIDDKAIFESAQKVYEEALVNEKSEGSLSDPDRL